MPAKKGLFHRMRVGMTSTIDQTRDENFEASHKRFQVMKTTADNIKSCVAEYASSLAKVYSVTHQLAQNFGNVFDEDPDADASEIDQTYNKTAKEMLVVHTEHAGDAKANFWKKQLSEQLDSSLESLAQKFAVIEGDLSLRKDAVGELDYYRAKVNKMDEKKAKEDDESAKAKKARNREKLDDFQAKYLEVNARVIETMDKMWQARSQVFGPLLMSFVSSEKAAIASFGTALDGIGVNAAKAPPVPTRGGRLSSAASRGSSHSIPDSPSQGSSGRGSLGSLRNSDKRHSPIAIAEEGSSGTMPAPKITVNSSPLHIEVPTRNSPSTSPNISPNASPRHAPRRPGSTPTHKVSASFSKGGPPSHSPKLDPLGTGNSKFATSGTGNSKFATSAAGRVKSTGSIGTSYNTVGARTSDPSVKPKPTKKKRPPPPT